MILSRVHSCLKWGGASIRRRASNGKNTVIMLSPCRQVLRVNLKKPEVDVIHPFAILTFQRKHVLFIVRFLIDISLEIWASLCHYFVLWYGFDGSPSIDLDLMDSIHVDLLENPEMGVTSWEALNQTMKLSVNGDSKNGGQTAWNMAKTSYDREDSLKHG